MREINKQSSMQDNKTVSVELCMQDHTHEPSCGLNFQDRPKSSG